MKLLNRIKKIEASAYPVHMQMLQDCSNMEDVADYCEVSVKHLHILCQDNWYIILGEHRKFIEVVDWASINGCTNPLKAFRFVEEIAGNKLVKLDAREKTSYPFLVLMARKGKIKIMHDSSWDWDGDIMHEMKIRIL